MSKRHLVLGAIALSLFLTQAAKVSAMPPEEFAQRIDALMEADWKARGITPAPIADDAEFLRRVYLDLAGRIPRVSEVHAFLADKSPDKRAKVVATLLDNPRYVLHMGNMWRNLLLPPNNNPQFGFAPGFKQWVDRQVQDNVPYNKMVREILTVPVFGNPGRGFNPGVANGFSNPAAFYQANEFKAENLAAATSRLFMGVKLECAQCHDHPFAKWTRKQFWEYAAFFSAMQPQGRVAGKKGDPAAPKLVPGRQIAIPGTDKIVQARYLDGSAPELEDNLDSRVTLAGWMTSPANPYFARTGVNRIWAHFFGVGIIDPVDDEPTDENPISHPELLANLTQQFVAHQYDVKYMIRAITASRTYQRSSAMSHPSQMEPRTFARMAVKGLTPDQLFDSLAQATGYSEQQPQNNGRIVVVPGFQVNARAEFIQLFTSQDKKTETQTSILQALALMNGKFIADATSLDSSRTLGALADAPFSNAQRIETLYVAALGRVPRPAEAARMLTYVNAGGSSGSERAALADVFWALLNSSEFIFNH